MEEEGFFDTKQGLNVGWQRKWLSPSAGRGGERGTESERDSMRARVTRRTRRQKCGHVKPELCTTAQERAALIKDYNSEEESVPRSDPNIMGRNLHCGPTGL